MIKPILSIFVFLLLAAVESKPTANNNHNHNHQNGNEDFDYLVFRQIWPPTSCMYPGNNTCKIDANVTTWVVHGLWPSIKSEIGPTFCNDSLKFNFDQVKWLLPKLLEFWPNLYVNTALDSFWKHEWEKHGTCALSLPQIRNESDYFNTTLGLRDHFDFGPILTAASVVPDDTVLYDTGKIRDAIQSVLGVEPMLVCYVLKDADVQYFSQMQICISKQFELVDCAFEALEMANISVDNTPQETQCQAGVPVHYPTFRNAKLIK